MNGLLYPGVRESFAHFVYGNQFLYTMRHDSRSLVPGIERYTYRYGVFQGGLNGPLRENRLHLDCEINWCNYQVPVYGSCADTFFPF